MPALRSRLTLALAVAGVVLAGGARAAVPEGIWSIPGKVAVRVFDCSGSLCGSVVWLRDPALRTPEMCGRTIIWGLHPTGANQWAEGWFFDPENRRTYNVTATLESPDRMSAQVYLGVPFLGHTENLLRTSLDQLPGIC